MPRGKCQWEWAQTMWREKLKEKELSSEENKTQGAENKCLTPGKQMKTSHKNQKWKVKDDKIAKRKKTLIPGKKTKDHNDTISGTIIFLKNKANSTNENDVKCKGCSLIGWELVSHKPCDQVWWCCMPAIPAPLGVLDQPELTVSKEKGKKGYLIIKSRLREKWDKEQEEESNDLIMYVPQKEDITGNSESYKGKRMRPKMSWSQAW